MKYAILVGDGMSDYPFQKSVDRTPIEIAKIYNMNEIVKKGMIESCKDSPVRHEAGKRCCQSFYPRV